MVDDYKCLEPGCPAYASSEGFFSMRGVGVFQRNIVVWYEKRVCWAGHRYQVEVYEEDARDVTEEQGEV